MTSDRNQHVALANCAEDFPGYRKFLLSGAA